MKNAILNEPIEVTLKVIKVFESLGIDYLVGGSLASAVYGIIRATMDTDIVADIRYEHIQPLVDHLQGEFYIDPGMVSDAI